MERQPPWRRPHDSTIIIESVTGTPRVWNVNPDAVTVTVINADTYAKIAEIAVGSKPSSLVLGGDGRIWVANKRTNTITRIDPVTRAVFGQIALPRGSAPHGLTAIPRTAMCSRCSKARDKSCASTQRPRAIIGTSVGFGANVRHLSVSSDGTKIYVARFVTPPIPGRTHRRTVDAAEWSTGGRRGGRGRWDQSFDTQRRWCCRTATRRSRSIRRPGLPNYLRAPVMSPDGLSAWVPSKQDNVLRGSLRNGAPLDHDHTVRAISSHIDLSSATADIA